MSKTSNIFDLRSEIYAVSCLNIISNLGDILTRFSVCCCGTVFSICRIQLFGILIHCLASYQSSVLKHLYERKLLYHHRIVCPCRFDPKFELNCLTISFNSHGITRRMIVRASGISCVCVCEIQVKVGKLRIGRVKMEFYKLLHKYNFKIIFRNSFIFIL